LLRFYRSPEVVLGSHYNVTIDMWSLGCVAAELFLGLPLFPGASEHDLLSRIIETLGSLPAWLLLESKNTEKFFRRQAVQVGMKMFLVKCIWRIHYQMLYTRSPDLQDDLLSDPCALFNLPSCEQGHDGQLTHRHVLLSRHEFEARNSGMRAHSGKRYFSHVSLPDIIGAYPMRTGLSVRTP
jgi:dual specificity protein kinase YAK1